MNIRPAFVRSCDRMCIYRTCHSRIATVRTSSQVSNSVRGGSRLKRRARLTQTRGVLPLPLPFITPTKEELRSAAVNRNAGIGMTEDGSNIDQVLPLMAMLQQQYLLSYLTLMTNGNSSTSRWRGRRRPLLYQYKVALHRTFSCKLTRL